MSSTGRMWSHCLRALEGELPSELFGMWLRPVQAVEDGHRLRLYAPNRFVIDWIRENALTRILALAGELAQQPVELTFEVGSRPEPATEDPPAGQGTGMTVPTGHAMGAPDTGAAPQPFGGGRPRKPPVAKIGRAHV